LIDSNTKNISIFDVLEELAIFLPPQNTIKKTDGPINIPIEFELVSLWKINQKRKKRKWNTIVEVYDPNKQKIGNFEQSFTLPENKERMRTIMKIIGFKFTKPGNYVFCVKIEKEKKYKLVAEIPIAVKINIPLKI